VTYTNNPQLVTVDTTFAGTPMIDGEFVNLTPRKQPGFMDLFKWMLKRGDTKAAKDLDPQRPERHELTAAQVNALRGITWLGHASFLIQTDSICLLIDPVSSFPFNKRYSNPPLSFDSLPKPDYVLVSHGHFDHYDAKVIAKLDAATTQALVPLQMGQRLVHSDQPNLKYQEAGWYQRFNTKPGVEVVFLPAKHWHRRGAFDMNKVLWGGFWIKVDGVTIYYSGDTSYGPHFAEIRKIMGSPDIALLPIGAYRPESIMKSSHMTPLEAVQAFNDLGAKVLVPCHWGTFDLSDEPPGDPIRWLRQIESEGLIHGKLVVPAIGGTIALK